MENREIIMQKEIKTVKADLRDFFFTSLKSKKQNKTGENKTKPTKKIIKAQSFFMPSLTIKQRRQ